MLVLSETLCLWKHRVPIATLAAERGRISGFQTVTADHEASTHTRCFSEASAQQLPLRTETGPQAGGGWALPSRSAMLSKNSQAESSLPYLTNAT